MILINLLPHRALARKKRKEAFHVALLAAALCGLFIAACIYLVYQYYIEEQEARNAFLTSEIQVLDTKISDIAKIDQEIAALRARQKAVEDLQADRNLPVHMLNDLVMQLPDGVYLESVKQVDQTVQIQGFAQSNERVSELLNNLANNTPGVSKPELVEVVGANTQVNAKDKRRVAGFNLRFKLIRPSEEGQDNNMKKKESSHG